jgi:hypothetical protein
MTRNTDVSRIGPASPASPAFTWAVVVLMILLAAWARFCFLGAPFKNDPGAFLAMGKCVAEGRQLYVDVWDNKFPGVTLLTTPLWVIFGTTWWPYVTATFLSAVASAFLLTRVPGVSRLATFAIAIATMNVTRMLTSGFQLETPITILTASAALCTLRATRADRRVFAWALLAGLFAGMAATFKPTGGAVAGACVCLCAYLAWRGEMRRAIQIALGGAAGLLVMLGVNLGWFTMLGVWPYLPEMMRELKAYADGTPWSQVFSVTALGHLMCIVGPAIWLGAIALVKRSRVDALPSDLARTSAVFAGCWLVIELIGLVMQKRGYAYHMLPIAVPATILCGLLVARFRIDWKLVAVPIVILAAWSVFTSIEKWNRTLDPEYRWSRAIDYVVQTTGPDDTIFGDPMGEMVVMADRKPGARLVQLIHFGNDHDAGRRFGDMVINDLEARQCTIVLLQHPAVLEKRKQAWEEQDILSRDPSRRVPFRAAWDRFVGYVQEHYTLERSDLDYQVWRRKGKTPTTGR